MKTTKTEWVIIILTLIVAALCVSSLAYFFGQLLRGAL